MAYGDFKMVLLVTEPRASCRNCLEIWRACYRIELTGRIASSITRFDTMRLFSLGILKKQSVSNATRKPCRLETQNRQKTNVLRQNPQFIRNSFAAMTKKANSCLLAIFVSRSVFLSYSLTSVILSYRSNKILFISLKNTANGRLSSY